MSNSSPLALAVLTLLGYIIGSLPFGYWFVRLRMGRDIRTMGSGNIGATNVQRSAGTSAGLIVLALDILKGVLAVAIAAKSTHNDPLALALAASAVVLGHCYPAFLRFKGGKAVACFIGAFGFIAPVALLLTALVFFAAVALSRYISLGSVLGAALFPFIFWYRDHPLPPLIVSAAFSAALIIYRHRANIQRLRTGTENTFTFRKKAI